MTLDPQEDPFLFGIITLCAPQGPAAVAMSLGAPVEGVSGTAPSHLSCLLK